jgi:hypothetical protein
MEVTVIFETELSKGRWGLVPTKITIHETVIQTCELAAILGSSTSWIRQLTRDGVFKQVDRGKYVLAEAVQDYNEHIRRDAVHRRISKRVK